MQFLLAGWWEEFSKKRQPGLEQLKDSELKKFQLLFTTLLVESDLTKEWLLKEILKEHMLTINSMITPGSLFRPTMIETTSNLSMIKEESQWRREWEITATTSQLIQCCTKCTPGLTSTSQPLWLQWWCQPKTTITWQLGTESTQLALRPKCWALTDHQNRILKSIQRQIVSYEIRFV